jgi:hypothetical protein
MAKKMKEYVKNNPIKMSAEKLKENETEMLKTL